MLCRLVLMLGIAAVGPAAAQTALDARQTRALTCSAMMYLGSAELRKAGRIDAATEKVVQDVALMILEEVPGRRAQRTQLMNARIKELAAGKTARQLLLEYDRIEKPCRDEFLG
jgi:hypothetical protein